MADPTVQSQFDFRSGQGGSSSIQILLESDEEAAEAWGVASSDPLAAAGWHEISPALTGGSIGRTRSTEKIRLENDFEWAEISSEDEIQIINTTVVVDPLRFNLIEWMEDNYFRVRYALPTNSDGGYEIKAVDGNASPTVDPQPVGHFWMFERVSADKEDWTMNIENNSLRDITFQLAASKPTASSNQRIYHQALLPLDTSITVPETDRLLRADWDESPYDLFADAAVTP